MRVFVDPERPRHQAEVEPAGNDFQLAQPNRPPVRKHHGARLAGREAIVGFAARRERMLELDVIAMLGRILRTIALCIAASPTDGESIVGGIEGVVASIALQVFRELRLRNRGRN